MFKLILLSIVLIGNLSASYRAFCAHKEQRHQERAIARGDYTSAMGGSLNLTQADISLSSRSGASGSATFTGLGGSTTLSFNTRIGGGVQFRSSFEEASPHHMAALANSGINPSAMAMSSANNNPALCLHNAAQSAINLALLNTAKPSRSTAISKLLGTLDHICGPDNNPDEPPTTTPQAPSSQANQTSAQSSHTTRTLKFDPTAKENFLNALHHKPEPNAGDALTALSASASSRTSAQSTFAYNLDRHVNTSLEFAAKRRGRTLSPPSRHMVTERSTAHFIRTHAAQNTLEMVTPNNALQLATYMPGPTGTVAEVALATIEASQGVISAHEALERTVMATGDMVKNIIPGLKGLNQMHRLASALPSSSSASAIPTAPHASSSTTSHANTNISPKIPTKAWEAEDVERVSKNFSLLDHNKTLQLPSPESLGHTPYAGGYQRSFITTKEEIYYRVYSGDNITGKFLTKTPPHSSIYAQHAFSLPKNNTAEFIQQVLVPEGTRLQRSRVIEAFDGKRGGAEQFELLERIPERCFLVGKKLESN